MSKTCLVTGGAGFIGCALSPLLAGQFSRVVAFDNLHPQVHPSAERPAALDSRVEFVKGDVTCPEDWDRVLKEFAPDVVIHLAAETGTGQSLMEASRHAHVNVTGTTQMLDALVRNNPEALPERIVLTSSRAVYGEGAWKDANGAIVYPGQRSREQLERAEWDFPGLKALPFNSHTTTPDPTSVYGATKLAQEHILSSWCLALGVTPVMLRLQNVYGPGQSLINSYTGIVSLFARMAKEGKSIPVYEDGVIIRDFVFIDDVANAIFAATIHSDGTTKPYDVGSGEATSVAQLAGIISRYYKAPEHHINGKYRHGDVRHASCTIDETKEVLNWSPKIMVEEGVHILCKWIDDGAQA
ncbi:NAD-dependent epimerase/dehydratase family protein [Pseudomonas sp. GM30]|uniref:NAD-dependent epimerase/dehydratase family protein n=1 Tax=Pseudomonas sp. GM30 TaxID=1144328 RepID=UPI0002702CD9|nr:NAD-dependent epimerase/dehydratase family protein [Pseudomonas sp. GM30]EUB82999.1 dTDP-glucose 4,6-dehydratase [Pseudomonas sp. GM30]